VGRTDVPEAKPGDVAFRLSWRAESGSLTGELEVSNVCDHAVRLSGKPGLTPIGIDGEPLAAETAVTLELRPPGYVVLAPGDRARAPVGWGGWDGPPAGGMVLVTWEGGQTEVTAHGPVQPEADGPATNLWSSWFERIE
jgi:Domain of unknown function (DUF4232)